MDQWIPFKTKKPKIGTTIAVLHYGNWPESRHVEHRAIVYRGDDGEPEPRPFAGYAGHFATATITHWKPIEEPDDE